MRSVIRIALSALLFATALPATLSADEFDAKTSFTDKRSPKPRAIRVITYIVQFLPEPASFKNERPRPEYRARRIADEVSCFDVVGLQETFHQQHRTQLINRLQSKSKDELNSVLSPTPNGFLTSGGCALF